MKKHILLTIAIALTGTAASAQVAASDAYNAGSQAYDFSNSETVTADPTTGVGYVANNNGEFYHFGPAANTLIVNGLYNAYDPNNNGFVGTPATPGVDYFQGLDGQQSTNQQIDGTVAPRFGILKLDNGSFNDISITNSNGAEVGNRTDFTNQYTTTVRSNSYIGSLRFLDNATYTEDQPSDNQYVNGYVGKIGNDAFTFPVGSQSTTDRRTLSISAPATLTDHLSIAYWQGDPNAGLDPTNGTTMTADPHPRSSLNTTPHPTSGEILKSVSPIGQWDWVAVSGTSTLAITASLPNGKGYAAGQEPNLRLVGWNIALAKWELLGTTGTVTGENAALTGTTAAYAGRTMASYSAIGWGNISALPAAYPLPVGLLSFEAVKQDARSSLLTWQTATEFSAAQFEAERSNDGKTFTAIGKVSAKGSNGTAQEYRLVDEHPLRGMNYYRLKIVHTDGTGVYTPVRKLNFDGMAGSIRIYPNPVTDLLTISVPEGGERELAVFNATGQCMALMTIAPGAVARLSTAQWVSGLYMAVITEGGRPVHTEKVTKQ